MQRIVASDVLQEQTNRARRDSKISDAVRPTQGGSIREAMKPLSFATAMTYRSTQRMFFRVVKTLVAALLVGVVLRPCSLQGQELSVEEARRAAGT